MNFPLTQTLDELIFECKLSNVLHIISIKSKKSLKPLRITLIAEMI